MSLFNLTAGGKKDEPKLIDENSRAIIDIYNKIVAGQGTEKHTITNLKNFDIYNKYLNEYFKEASDDFKYKLYSLLYDLKTIVYNNIKRREILVRKANNTPAEEKELASLQSYNLLYYPFLSINNHKPFIDSIIYCFNNNEKCSSKSMGIVGSLQFDITKFNEYYDSLTKNTTKGKSKYQQKYLKYKSKYLELKALKQQQQQK